MPTDKILAREAAEKICAKYPVRSEFYEELKQYVADEIHQAITSATADLRKENEELKRMLAANPTPADMDAAIFEINRLTAQLSATEAVKSFYREQLQLIAGEHPTARRLSYSEQTDLASKTLKQQPASRDFVRAEDAIRLLEKAVRRNSGESEMAYIVRFSQQASTALSILKPTDLVK